MNEWEARSHLINSPYDKAFPYDEVFQPSSVPMPQKGGNPVSVSNINLMSHNDKKMMELMEELLWLVKNLTEKVEKLQKTEDDRMKKILDNL